MPKLTPEEKKGTGIVMAEVAAILFIAIFWAAGTFDMFATISGVSPNLRAGIGTAGLILLCGIAIDLARRLIRGDWKVGSQ